MMAGSTSTFIAIPTQSLRWVLVTLCILSFGTECIALCPSADWLSYNNHCYAGIKHSSFVSASATCASYEAWVVEINDELENAWLKDSFHFICGNSGGSSGDIQITQYQTGCSVGSSGGLRGIGLLSLSPGQRTYWSHGSPSPYRNFAMIRKCGQTGGGGEEKEMMGNDCDDDNDNVDQKGVLTKWANEFFYIDTDTGEWVSYEFEHDTVYVCEKSTKRAEGKEGVWHTDPNGDEATPSQVPTIMPSPAASTSIATTTTAPLRSSSSCCCSPTSLPTLSSPVPSLLLSSASTLSFTPTITPTPTASSSTASSTAPFSPAPSVLPTSVPKNIFTITTTTTTPITTTDKPTYPGPTMTKDDPVPIGLRATGPTTGPTTTSPTTTSNGARPNFYTVSPSTAPVPSLATALPTISPSSGATGAVTLQPFFSQSTASTSPSPASTTDNSNPGPSASTNQQQGGVATLPISFFCGGIAPEDINEVYSEIIEIATEQALQKQPLLPRFAAAPSVHIINIESMGPSHLLLYRYLQRRRATLQNAEEERVKISLNIEITLSLEQLKYIRAAIPKPGRSYDYSAVGEEALMLIRRRIAEKNIHPNEKAGESSGAPESSTLSGVSGDMLAASINQTLTTAVVDGSLQTSISAALPAGYPPLYITGMSCDAKDITINNGDASKSSSSASSSSSSSSSSSDRNGDSRSTHDTSDIVALKHRTNSSSLLAWALIVAAIVGGLGYLLFGLIRIARATLLRDVDHCIKVQDQDAAEAAAHIQMYDESSSASSSEPQQQYGWQYGANCAQYGINCYQSSFPSPSLSFSSPDGHSSKSSTIKAGIENTVASYERWLAEVRDIKTNSWRYCSPYDKDFEEGIQLTSSTYQHVTSSSPGTCSSTSRGKDASDSWRAINLQSYYGAFVTYWVHGQSSSSSNNNNNRLSTTEQQRQQQLGSYMNLETCAREEDLTYVVVDRYGGYPS